MLAALAGRSSAARVGVLSPLRLASEMPGPISSSDSSLPASPVNCRWATLAKHEASTTESHLVDLPPSVQVARGKELLSMLQETSFPLGDSTSNSMPVPPSEMPPPPPGFEVPSSGFSIEAPGGALVPNGAGPQQPGEWVPAPNGHHSGPHQSHFVAPRSTAPAAQPSPSGATPVWGMSGCLGAGAPGTWAPLSTNPSSMSPGGWLSTGVSDCGDGHGVAVSSAPMAHVSHSSASSAHVPYSMPQPANADNGLWSASHTPPTPVQVGLTPAMLQTQVEQPGFRPQQLRAEAAPYVPMNSMGVGVPAC